jgi:hypothetical protein
MRRGVKFRPTKAAGSGGRALSALCSLFNLQPAGVSIPKHIAQIGNLIGRHRIGMRLQQRF